MTLDDVERAVLALLVGAGLWVRLPLWSLGPTRNELQNIDVFGVGPVSMLWGVETSVNPPLWRGLFTVLLEDPANLAAGRTVALLCSLAAGTLAWWLIRSLGGRPMLGLLGAILMLLHPQLIEEGVKHRAYAAWSVAALLHLGAVARAMDADGGTRRTWTRLAIVTGIAMGWLHYLSVPVLGVLALGVGSARPELRRIWVWSLASLLPLAPAVLRGSSANVPPPSDRWPELLSVMGWQLERSLDLAGFPRHLSPGTAAALVCAGVVASLVRHRGTSRAVPAWAALGGLLAVATLGQLQVVRPAATVVTLTLGLPSVLLLPRARLPSIGLAVVVLALCAGLPELHRARAERRDAQQDPAAAVALLREGAHDTVAVVPAWSVELMELPWLGHRQRPGEPLDCGDMPRCLDHDGTRVLGLRRPEDLPRDVATLVTFEGLAPPADRHCTPSHVLGNGRTTLWTCPP